MAFHELRQYQVKPGKMEVWLDLMEGEIIPYITSKGMVMTASFRGEEDESVYVWIRRFENEEQRERLYTAVYESDHWKNVLSPKIGDLINREASKRSADLANTTVAHAIAILHSFRTACLPITRSSCEKDRFQPPPPSPAKCRLRDGHR